MVVEDGRAAAPSRRVPQSLQKRAPGTFVAPHVGQPLAIRAPHSLQNFAPATFSAAQLGQITPPGTS